jgi:hypothetical protein
MRERINHPLTIPPNGARKQPLVVSPARPFAADLFRSRRGAQILSFFSGARASTRVVSGGKEGCAGHFDTFQSMKSVKSVIFLLHRLALLGCELLPFYNRDA